MMSAILRQAIRKAYDPMQEDKSLEVSGVWPRSTQYEMVKGTVVPAQGAEFREYDPWQSYRANVGKYRTVEHPYCSLLELGRSLEYEDSRGVRPSRMDLQRPLGDSLQGPPNQAEQLILDWCNKHGLLGLVPVLSTSIHVGGEFRHIRDGGSWVTVLKHEGPPFSIVVPVQSGEDSLSRVLTKGDGSLTWLNWFSHEYDTKLLAEKRAYFSARNDNGAFAAWRPGSQRFWANYGEPVHELYEWCSVFTQTV